MTMMNMMSQEQDATARLRESPWKLMRQAMGSRTEVTEKLWRLGSAIAGYRDGGELDARLAKLQSKGFIEQIPNRVQLAVGGLDMVRFWITPAAADYYASKGINFTFHQVLRVLDEPASMVDPVGFFSTRDGIIGHLMQVVHANPVYDFELLSMFDDGHDELQSQLQQMLDNTHPRAASIRAVVEEPDYHARLLAFAQAWVKDPTTPPMLRSNVGEGSEFSRRERTFGSLRTSMRYFCRLPSTPFEGAMHLLTVKEYPEHLGE